MVEVIQVKRGVFANMPSLASGEFYFATDLGQLYVGPIPTQIGGSGNSVQQLVGFGNSPTTSEDTIARSSVSAPWVTSNTKLVCSVVEGADHTDDEIAAEQVMATVGNIQSGVGFDVVLSSPNGSSGNFTVNIRG